MAQQKAGQLARQQPINIVGTEGESAADTYGRLMHLGTIINGTLDTFEDGIDILSNPKWPTALLMLPGMDKLLFVMGLVKDYEFLDKVEKWDSPVMFAYRFKCILRDKRTGMIVAQGFGLAHSKESGVGKQTDSNILNQVHKIDAVGRSRSLRDAMFSVAPIRRRFSVAEDVAMTNPEVVQEPQVQVSKPDAEVATDRPKARRGESQPTNSQNTTMNSETTSTKDDATEKLVQWFNTELQGITARTIELAHADLPGDADRATRISAVLLQWYEGDRDFAVASAAKLCGESTALHNSVVQRIDSKRD